MGSGKRAAGLHVLTNALLHACVLEIAKIALDTDRRTPSVSKLVAALDDSRLLAELREDYAVCRLPSNAEDNPDVIAVLKRMEQREKQKRREQFDSLVGQLRSGWVDLRDSAALAGFVTMRQAYRSQRTVA